MSTYVVFPLGKRSYQYAIIFTRLVLSKYEHKHSFFVLAVLHVNFLLHYFKQIYYGLKSFCWKYLGPFLP